MRVPLSWLRDFAPFGDDAAALAAALDDLGLVVEAIERGGRGPGPMWSWPGSSRSGRSTGRTRSGGWWWTTGRLRSRWSVARGTSTSATWSRWLRSEPVLPGGMEIGRRKLKGVVSNGMLCSGRGAPPVRRPRGHPAPQRGRRGGTGRRRSPRCWASTRTWSSTSRSRPTDPTPGASAGVARDLAARLALPFAIPSTAALVAAASGTSSANDGPHPAGGSLPAGPEVRSLASVQVEDLELCPRLHRPGPDRGRGRPTPRPGWRAA